MVNSVHVSSSLRVTRVRDGVVQGVRTFSGVRRDIAASNVADLFGGLNMLLGEPVSGALLTTRAQLKRGE